MDISPELAELTRKRLPLWTDHIFVGNAIDWEPPRRFDFVRTGLEYVPKRKRPNLIGRLLERVVVPGGRLIIGTFNEERISREDLSKERSNAELIRSWG
jgi:hypothetical protein